MKAKEQQVSSVFEFVHPSGCLTSSCLIPKLVMPTGRLNFHDHAELWCLRK